MAKIGLSEGFTLIPKGTHVFKIVEVKYKEDFGKMEIVMQGGLNAFSYFAKTALNDYTLTEIDHEELVGHYIRCEVDHEEVESNKTPGKMLKFVRLGDKEPADGFDEAPAPKKESKPAATAPAAAPAEKAGGKKFDLDSILG